jgi:ectoine hydroxylase-related dioxygenase (phytanoyl-CoA dioxygenase family)
MRPTEAYGVQEQELPAGVVEQHAERIRLAGYTILPSGFSPAEIDDFARRLDGLLRQQTESFGGGERMASIGDAWTVRCPLADDDAFLRLAAHPSLLALCRHVLGDYIVLMQQNGIVNPPGQRHAQRAHHRDLPYQHFTSSRPLALSALFCIDPFEEATGATIVIPASHRVEAFPSDDVARALEAGVAAPPGAFIVFDSMLFHRAGDNRSEAPRRAVNQVFTLPIIGQQISLPAALGGRHADDPALRRLLGYETEPAGSALAWRERRLARGGQHGPPRVL